ncbi:hypothetical protein DV735_g2464, partial [Chaetothyriales sp. CBS 134920]
MPAKAPTARYASLQPHTTHISRSRIEKTWRPLSRHAQDRGNNTNNDAVTAIVAKLTRRIPRMPFPRAQATGLRRHTSTETTDMDFEATLTQICTLEAQLAETVQSSKLLREQVRREEAAAARDRAAYRVLEAGARSEQGMAREQGKKLHWFELNIDDDEKGGERDYGPTVGLTGREIDADEQLKTLVLQLRGHIDSIAQNTAPLVGVSAALDDAQQALLG